MLFRWRVIGAENVPRSGPLVLAGNHFSTWDPPLMGCSVRRPVSFIAKEELFRFRPFGWVLRNVHAVPIKRGQADIANLKRMLETLQKGGVLGMFPEGTRQRSGELGAPQPGVAWLAHKCDAPVVPMAIIGPYRLWQPLTVRIGAPLDICAGLPERPRTADLEAAGKRVMEVIAELRRRGHPAVDSLWRRGLS